MAKKPEATKDWPADHVERWPIDRLVPYARNSRLHSETQLNQISGSIKEWGWTVPVLVDENGGLIAGHARVMAAKKLGIKEVPTMIAKGWSEAQKRAYVIADNKLATNATWDNDMLLQELGDITEDGIDLSIVGFSPQEMDALLGVKDEGQGAGDTGPADNFASQYAVMVTCKSEPDQERVYNELQAQGYNVKVVAV